MICLVCGNKNEKEFTQYLSLDYLSQCQKCGMVFMSEIKQAENYYQDKTSREFDSAKQNTRFRNCCNRLGEFKNFLNRRMNILDVGCNEGSFLKVARDAGYKITGLEPNTKLVEYARGQGLPVIEGTLEDFRPEQDFDVITLFNVLEHLKEPKAALDKVRSLLAPAGFLVLEIPNIGSFLAKKMKEDWEMITIEHFFYFSPKTIQSFLNNCGFKVRKISVRQFDEWHLGVKESLTRLGFNLFKTKKYPPMASPESKPAANIRRRKRVYVDSIRVVLSALVKIFKRGDYLLIVAQKCNENE